jgi:hypothetical protein
MTILIRFVVRISFIVTKIFWYRSAGAATVTAYPVFKKASLLT